MPNDKSVAEVETKHTPGPWRVDDDGQDVLAPDGELLSTAYPMIGFDRRHFANARLLAAAPDMLSALRTLAALIDEDGADLNDAYAAAVAAIAKAEGRAL